MTDTAEYWQDIKGHYPYFGPNYYHVPNFNCGHRHLYEAQRLGDVNCRGCFKLIKEGQTHNLLEGKTDFRSKGQKKRDRRINNQIKLGKCKCGKQRVYRFNKTTHEKFIACSGYPTCKITQSINQ